jgi:hypothetical protein
MVNPQTFPIGRRNGYLMEKNRYRSPQTRFLTRLEFFVAARFDDPRKPKLFQTLPTLGAVTQSPHQVSSRGTPLFGFGDPRLEPDGFAGKSWTDVGDEVRTHNPNRPVLEITLHRPAPRSRMLNGDILHPGDVLQIAHVSQLIDGMIRDAESLGKHSRQIGDSQGHNEEEFKNSRSQGRIKTREQPTPDPTPNRPSSSSPAP